MKRIFFLLLLLALMPLAAGAKEVAGDVDGNGNTNIADVTVLIDYLITLDASTIDVAAGDIDGDGTVCVADVTCLIDLLLAQQTPEPQDDDHEWVDLGLPSGTLWATCNIGASAPEEYGDYFAWGETEPKDYYDWSTYKWCNGSRNTLTKYCSNSSYGNNGFVDNKTELDLEDDAAYVNWGSSWRMPTQGQTQELDDNCTWEWTQRNGVNGVLLVGPNGNTMFLPAAGCYWYGYESVINVGEYGYFWSRTRNNYYQYIAYDFSYYSSAWFSGQAYRCIGYTVRAVRVP